MQVFQHSQICASAGARDRCHKRSLLTALTVDGSGDPTPIKEPFFFGGTGFNYYRSDLLSLHGPDPRSMHSSLLSRLPPLWLWQQQQRRSPKKLQMERVA